METLQDRGIGKGKVRFLVYEAGKLVRTTPWSHNKIALNDDHGLNLLLKRHISDLTYDLQITQGRFGTDNTARTAAQTDLIAPYATYYPRTNSYMVDDTSCVIEIFVPSSLLPDDTYEEFAVYCDSQYYASAVLSPALVKGTNQDVLVQYQITYST